MTSGEDELDNSIKISDSVVMGDIHINQNKHQLSTEQSLIPEAFKTNEKQLRDFIQGHWIEILDKHTSERIKIEDHSVVVVSLFQQIFSLSPSDSDREEISLALRIYNALMIDGRILKSATMLSELALLRATSLSKKNEFKGCKESLSVARDHLFNSKQIDNEPTLGVFELISCWWNNDGQQKTDTIDELAADLIAFLCENKSFMIEHGEWLLQTCEQNLTGTSWPEMFRFVKLNRWLEDYPSVMFETILENESFSIEQFERFTRLMFHQNTGLFSRNGEGHVHDGETERDNFLQLTTRSIQLKMFEIFPLLDTENNETKIDEFWNWFELLAFILTVKQSEVNHRWTLRKSNSDTGDDIFGLMSSFFSELGKLSTAKKNAFLKEKFAAIGKLAERIFGAINALNVTYSCIYDGDAIIFASQFNTSITEWFEFLETDFGISWNYSIFGTEFSMKPEFMPKWWVGNPIMAANPEFGVIYSQWKKGTKISDIEPPCLNEPPSL